MSIAPLPSPGDTTPELADLTPEQLLTLATNALPRPGQDPLTGVNQLAAIDRLTSWLAARKLSVVSGLCPFDASAVEPWWRRHRFFEELKVACRIGEVP